MFKKVMFLVVLLLLICGCSQKNTSNIGQGIMKVAISSMTTTSGTYLFNITSNGMIEVYKGTRLTDDINSKYFLLSPEKKERKLTVDELKILNNFQKEINKCFW